MNLRQIINKLPIAFTRQAMSEDIDKSYENLTEDQFQSLMADSADSTTITVEVAYLTNERQVVLEAQVPRGANIEDGIMLSGLLEECHEIELSSNKVGLYGVIKPLSEVLTDGDRIEIYRPVTAKQ